MKRFFMFVSVIFLCAVTELNAQDVNERTYNYPVLNAQANNRRMKPKPRVEGWATQRVEEKINRGVVALREDNGNMYLSWRLLKSDPQNVAFNVYCSLNGGKASKLNSKPLLQTTDFTYTKAPKSDNATYFVRPIVGGKELEASEKVTPIADGKNYTSIKFQGDYVIQKVAMADLNGDGIYDFIVKQPNQTVDPGVWRKSETTWKVEAYLNDGTFLWRKDLGWNIEQGVWYSPFIAYDLNGDGRAEIAVKTAPTDKDYRDKNGRVVGNPRHYDSENPYTDNLEVCPEYCSILDGMTGEEIARTEWPAASAAVGDYVRINRNQMALAYLDGKTPCLLLNRGTYRAMLVDAYQLNGKKLEKLWSWNGDEENPAIRSMGAHQIVSADVDGDGRDEVIMGSVTIDDNGEALWSTGFGHPDKAIVTDIDPTRPGLEIFYAIEVWHEQNGVALVDARTGETIWNIGHHTTHVGDGIAVDIDPAYPGLECFAAESGKAGSTDRYMFNAAGERIGTTVEEIPGMREWIWWDGDLLRETTSRNKDTKTLNMVKYKGDTLTRGIEGNIMMIADVKGDWREEIITMLPGELRIYSTVIPAKDRRVSLIQDPLYRSYITHRSMGYDQPPMTSYYLGVPVEQSAKYTPIIEKKK